MPTSRRLSYREIADELESRIRAGTYPPGGLMPSYADVAREFHVSVTTAQSALRILRTKGLTEGDPGRGTFVVAVLPEPT